MAFRLGRVAAPWLPGVFDFFARPRADADVSVDAMRWKRKAIRREATTARLKTALERADSKYHELLARFDARRRATLDHAVLRQLLPIRALHPTRPASDRMPADARETHLCAVSADYRAAIEDADPSTPLHRTEIDGLAWWVPLHERDAPRVQRSRAQGFPYRTILQTREVAIGGLMLDIGANIGRTSIPRVMLGDVRAVYAAEPEPANYTCLIRNVVEHNLRGFVLPDRVAIGARRGEARLRRSRYPGGHRVVGASADCDTVAVPVWPLDEWVAHLAVDLAAITFVKIDTQGSELDVLRGAPGLLARPHISWLLELDPELLRRAGASATELLALLEHHFSHFIDIGSPEPGPRVGRTAQLREAVAYLGQRQKKTDLILFHAVARSS